MDYTYVWAWSGKLERGGLFWVWGGDYRTGPTLEHIALKDGDAYNPSTGDRFGGFCRFTGPVEPPALPEPIPAPIDKGSYRWVSEEDERYIQIGRRGEY